MPRCSAHKVLAIFLDVYPFFWNASLEEEGEGRECQGQPGRGEGLGWKMRLGRGGKAPAKARGGVTGGQSRVVRPASSTHPTPSLHRAAGEGYPSFVPLPCPARGSGLTSTARSGAGGL